MFVKIRYLKCERDKNQVVTKSILDREVVYDCKRVSLNAKLPEPPEVDVTEMQLIMDVGNRFEPDERCVDIPLHDEYDNQVIEIYYMNSEGKTVEKIIY